VKSSYSRRELDSILGSVSPRRGWDFARTADQRASTPWDYAAVVSERTDDRDDLLDVGTGGGEMLLSFADRIGSGVGIDLDPEMVELAIENGRGASNISFRQSSHLLENVPESFDVVVDRHAPFSLDAVRSHLRQDGLFITQQVGERNMANVKGVLSGDLPPAPITREMFADPGVRLVDFREYDVEYVVHDVESLVFWLSALDLLHADVDGSRAVADVDTFNAVLRGNVTSDGFVTNEHRYLAIAQRVGRDSA